MTPLECSVLREMIDHALSTNDGDPHFDLPENIHAYCAEQQAQCLLVLQIEYSSEAMRRAAGQALAFWTGVSGRAAEVTGGGYGRPPSIYRRFDSPEGNQIDSFLIHVGFSVG